MIQASYLTAKYFTDLETIVNAKLIDLQKEYKSKFKLIKMYSNGIYHDSGFSICYAMIVYDNGE